MTRVMLLLFIVAVAVSLVHYQQHLGSVVSRLTDLNSRLTCTNAAATIQDIEHVIDGLAESHTNPWRGVTISEFRCDNLTLAECLTKFNEMHLEAETLGGKPLRVHIDDSATTINGTIPDTLSKNQFADMLAEAYATTNMSLLRDQAQTLSVTLNFKNAQAAELIKTVMDVTGFPADIHFDGPVARIRKGPHELSVRVVKNMFPLEIVYARTATSELVNVTTFFRESRDPLSVRYHVPSDTVVLLTTPSQVAGLMSTIGNDELKLR